MGNERKQIAREGIFVKGKIVGRRQKIKWFWHWRRWFDTWHEFFYEFSPFGLSKTIQGKAVFKEPKSWELIKLGMEVGVLFIQNNPKNSLLTSELKIPDKMGTRDTTRN